MCSFVDCDITIQHRTSDESGWSAGVEVGHKALPAAWRYEGAVYAADPSARPEEVSKRSNGKN